MSGIGNLSDGVPVAEPQGQLEPAQGVEPSGEQVVEAALDTEVVAPVEEASAEPVEPKGVYTPDEVKELLKAEDFSAIDTSRLSEEGQLLMKSMQSGLTPKLQAASEMKKQNEVLQEEMQAIREEIKKSNAPEPETIYDYYDQDPDGTLDYIENTIKKMQATDPQANAYQINQLNDMVRNLERYEVKKMRTEAQTTKQLNEAVYALQSKVPNIATIQHELKDFALDMFGYTETELARLTDIGARGMDAVDAIVRINNAYTKVNATKTAAQKKVPVQPTQVEAPGGPAQGQRTQDTDHFELRRKAAKGEASWRDVLMQLEP